MDAKLLCKRGQDHRLKANIQYHNKNWFVLCMLYYVKTK